jgi:hypothetical protein
MERVRYKEADIIDQLALLSSRGSTFAKDGVSNMWIRVILRAVDDLILCEYKYRKNGSLTDEEMEFETTANGFLFDYQWRIPLDDYLVNVICQKCKRGKSAKPMSKVAGNSSVCECCGHKTSWKYVVYETIPGQDIKDISFNELISSWGFENVNSVREYLKQYIETEVNSRLGLQQTEVTKMTDKKKKETKVEKAEGLVVAMSQQESPGNEEQHYQGDVQPIDFIEAQSLGAHEANIVKYVCRWRQKGGIQDLLKIVWYVMRLIKLSARKNDVHWKEYLKHRDPKDDNLENISD